MEFNPSQETIDLVCKKYGYTPTIKVSTGETVKGRPVYVEKEISKEDFFYNYYSQMMDNEAGEQKRMDARQAALEALPSQTVSDPQVRKIPVPTKEEIAAAAAEALGESKP